MNDSKKYWISTHVSISKPTLTILNEYLLSIKLENRAVATITKYRSILERFLSECTIPLEELTSQDVRKWLNEFSVGKKPKTIDLVLATLSSFFTFCLTEEYMDKTVMKKRWRPKISKSLPKHLDEFEYARVKLVAEELSIRDRALILFLLSSGCRVSEVSNLNIHDVNFKARTAEVIGKGKKIRHVHFSVECALVLNDYIQTRSCDPTEPLFISKFGKRLLVDGMEQVVKKAGKKAGLKQTFHPHCCRHTFATNMLARGADLQFIADEMGHENLNTTRIYARIPTDDLILKYQNIMG
jgi:integrase/recombinase XerD